MGSTAPQPGCCGAKLRGREEFCERRPLTGKDRCKLHGGASTGPKGGHGLRSGAVRLRRADEGLNQRMEELLSDPELLDARRPVAMSQVALELLPLEAGRAHAERLVKRRLAQDKREVEEDEFRELVDAVLDELHATYAERVVTNANAHARTIGVAVKQERLQDLLLKGAEPIMRDFAIRVAALTRKYLSPTQQAAFLLDLRRVAEDTKRALLHMGEEADLKVKG